MAWLIGAMFVLFMAIFAVMRYTGVLQKKQNRDQTDASDAEDVVSLDWYVNFSWFLGSWGDNLVSKEITDHTGVTINFVTPSGNENEKLSALMSTNSLPDLITLGSWESQVNDLVDQNMVYALNELADSYDPVFWNVTDELVRNWYTKEDGNLYCYPSSYDLPEDLEENDNISSNQTFLVRRDIYEAIGSPDMSTQEGFCNAVKQATEMFPTVDGEPLIPIGAHVFDQTGCVSFDDYLQNFLAIPYEKDGEVYDRFTDPEYLSWLKMFRQLGEEGYLSSDIFVDSRTQMDEKVAQGRYFCMLYQYTDMIHQQEYLYATNPDSIYIAVDGPKNSAGDDPRLPVTGIGGWTVTLISKTCKDPQKAFELMTYMLGDEAQKLTYLGKEGVTYDVVDGVPVMKEEVRSLLNSDRVEYDRIYGADDTYWMFQKPGMRRQWKQKEPEEISQLKEWSYPYVNYTVQYSMLLIKDSKESAIDTKISRIWASTLPKLLLAESDTAFDQILQAFIEKRNQLGFDEVQAAKNKSMLQAKEKLGIE